MKHKERNSNGLAILLKDVKGYSQAQSAWRFYNNNNVDIKSLNKPIIEEGIKNIKQESDKYLLIAHDWSLINYRNHESKKDCIEVNRSKNNKSKSKGYELQSSLAISDITGEPITPLVHNLKTKDKVYSTYDNNINISTTHLNELKSRIEYIDNKLNIDKIKVHIIDREADSSTFLRELKKNNFYIIRAIDDRKVEYNNEEMKQKELANRLRLGKYVKSIQYKNRQVKIYVNSVNVKITRDSYIIDKSVTNKTKYKRVKGKTIDTRFIVERLVDKDNKIVATWLLISNLKDNVDDKTIALWYYYRWNIESYFKLLKSSGFNLESWQQVKSEAIFKRLLIASYASLLVWQIEHSNKRNIVEIKKFLVKLSGRLIQRGKVSTSPALLAGIWNFFSAMDIIELYDIDKLLSMKRELNDFLGMEF